MQNAGSHDHGEITPSSDVNVPRCIKTWKKTLALQENGHLKVSSCQESNRMNLK